MAIADRPSLEPRIGSSSGNGRAQRSEGRRGPVSRRRGDTPRGVTVERFWTTAGVSPYDEVEWELRTAVITGPGRHYVLVALTRHKNGDAYLEALAPAVDDLMKAAAPTTVSEPKKK